MELIVVYIIGSIGVLWLLVTIIGITIYDVRSIQLSRELHRHPHARRWRRRPMVSVVYDGVPTQKSLLAVQSNHYKNLQIINISQVVIGEVVVYLSTDTVIDRTAIYAAVRHYNYFPVQKNSELVPVIEQPKSMRQFFRAYQLIVTGPFIAARSGLGYSVHQSYSYEFLRWIVQVANLVTLMYVSYIAVALYQPEFLLLYMVGFTLWLLFSLFTYPHLTTFEKITYFVLAPASLGYLLLRCIVAPVRPLYPRRILTLRLQSDG